MGSGRGSLFPWWKPTRRNTSTSRRRSIGRKEGRKQGRKEGRKEGSKKGRKQERKEGRKDGMQEGREGGRKEGKIESDERVPQNMLQLTCHQATQRQARKPGNVSRGDTVLQRRGSDLALATGLRDTDPSPERTASPMKKKHCRKSVY